LRRGDQGLVEKKRVELASSDVTGDDTPLLTIGLWHGGAEKDATAPLRREDGWSAHHNPNLESELGPLPFRLGDLRFELVESALPVGWGHVAFGGREREVCGGIRLCRFGGTRRVFAR